MHTGPLKKPRLFGLLAVVVVYISRGMSYTVPKIPEPLPFGLDALATLVPIQVYGALWFLAAADGLWLALALKRSAWGIAFMTGMPTLWSLAYLISWIGSGLASRDWAPMMLYACMSVIAVCFCLIDPRRVVLPDGLNRSE